MRRNIAVWSALSVIAGMVIALPTPAGAATWDADVRIAFSRNCDIWIAHPSGSNLKNLTSDVSECAMEPTYSHTGQYVVYQEGFPRNTWKVDVLTGQRAKVPGKIGVAPDLSPTSDTLAFHRYDVTSRVNDIYTTKLDGSGEKNWTNDAYSESQGNYRPTWDASGNALIYYASEGVRMCREDMGGYDDIHAAYRLMQVTSSGAASQLAYDPNWAIFGGARGGGVLAYVRNYLPPTDADGYCASQPTTQSQTVIAGRVYDSDTYTPTVAATGDVAFSDAGTIMALKPGGTTATPLFAGSDPDWGIAYAVTGDDCTIKGTEGPDRLVGTAGSDVICGYGESDVLLGNGGADILRGGDGEDDLAGGPGRDTLEGGDHADALRGDEGDDALDGGPGVDLVTYFTSHSQVTVDLGKGTARAGTHGNDTIHDVEGAFGSKTGDTLIGNGASNHLFGGPGKDSVRGMGGTDLLHGTAGKDRLAGGAGGDLLEGDEGNDVLNGGASRDACYDDRATRASCEYDEESDPMKRGKPPASASTSTQALNAGEAVRANGAPYWTWDLGNHDYLIVYSRATTRTIASWANTAGWENQVCHFLRYSPVKGACAATGALNAVSKYQMKWFLWNAKANDGCAIGILDWGRHGVNQFKRRWKVRSATFARYNVAIPWVTAGKYSDIKTNDGSSIRVYCY